jgi:hypothetical protein
MSSYEDLSSYEDSRRIDTSVYSTTVQKCFLKVIWNQKIALTMLLRL